MNKEMIISSGDHDTRVAILEDDQVVEIFIERERSRGVVGNIYKGRVSKVLPGMQSSFVDIGLERDAFLYVTEVVNTVEEFERLESGEDEDDETLIAATGRAPALADDGARRGRRRRRRPSTSRGRARGAERQRPRRPPRPRSARAPRRSRPRHGPSRRSRTCSRKGRRSSSRSSRSRSAPRARASPRTSRMPGRFLVFMPTVDHVGVSRKIESREERARLRGIVKSFREEHGFIGGVIIRTAAAGRSEEDIVSDLS